MLYFVVVPNVDIATLYYYLQVTLHVQALHALKNHSMMTTLKWTLKNVRIASCPLVLNQNFRENPPASPTVARKQIESLQIFSYRRKLQQKLR